MTKPEDAQAAAQPAVKYAGFWKRALAHLLDSIVLNLAAWAVEAILLWGSYGVYYLITRREGAEVRAFDDLFSPFLIQIVDGVGYLLLALVYFTWGHYRYGTTLGKRPLRIYVVNAADGAPLTLGQSTLRCLAYVVSYLPLGCGFFMAGFHPQKRALHDLIAGTVSVIKRK